jgi:hypothetical protein
MSGPALRQLDAHQAIHEAAYAEVLWRAERVRQVCHIGDRLRLLRAAEALLTFLETRILRHASEEESGLYREWSNLGIAALSQSVLALAKEHDDIREHARRLDAAVATARVTDVDETLKALLDALSGHQAHEEAVLAESARIAVAEGAQARGDSR